jgi:hypothetical protein
MTTFSSALVLRINGIAINSIERTAAMRFASSLALTIVYYDRIYALYLRQQDLAIAKNRHPLNFKK